MSDSTSSAATGGPRLALASLAIHGGQSPDPSTGAVMPPIYATSTYAQSSPGVHQGLEYSRTHNPTRLGYERCVASLSKGGLDAARRPCENTKLVTLAQSAGGVESLVNHPAVKARASVPVERREALGIEGWARAVECGDGGCKPPGRRVLGP